MLEGLSFSMILDALVAVLLVTTIAYAAVLNRRIAGLRAGRAEMEALIAGLTAAAAKAEGGIRGLKSASEEQGAQLQQHVDKAKALRDDLSYLLDRGDNLADKLAGSIRSSRQLAHQATPAPAVAAERARPGEAGASKTERALLRALQEMR